MTNQLIYFTVSNNIEYIKLAQLCVESLYRNSYDGDFLFITNLKSEILSVINFIKKPFFLELNTNGLFDSSSNKLRLYLFHHLENYDKIIFSDVDILWLSSPDTIFSAISENKFYVSNEPNLMSEIWWGESLLSSEEKETISKNRVRGINAGVFGMTTEVVYHLKEIETFIGQNVQKINICLEQPFLNVYLYRNKLYNNVLSNQISHSGYNLDRYDGTLLHFAGGPGNFATKYNKMLKYIEKNNLV
jgi:hypothetical protein